MRVPVVVLDQQHSGVAGQHRPQLPRPRRAHRGAGRILRPVGDHERPGPGAAARARTSSGSGPSSSTRIGTGRSPSAGTRSSRLPQPGSSTATASPGLRWAASTRSIASSDPEVTATGPAGTPSASRAARAEPRELRVHRASPYSPGRCAYARAAAASASSSGGQQRRVRVALRQIPYAGRRLDPERAARRTGGARAHPAAPRPAVSITPRSRRVRYAAATVLGLTPSSRRQLPHGRQQLPRRELARAHRPLHTRGNLRCTSPDDPILS